MKFTQAICKLCGDHIISKHRHNFVWCKCKSIAVDGGSVYGRYVGNPENMIISEKLTKYKYINENNTQKTTAKIKETKRKRKKKKKPDS